MGKEVTKKAKAKRNIAGTEDPRRGSRTYFSQTDFPANTLQDAQKIATGLDQEFGGGEASPPDIALAIGYSPTSSLWRYLCGSAVSYGVTDGSYNAPRIKLTSLGSKLVAPQEEGADVDARREAILKPRIMREFFEKYRRAKFPSDLVGISVLKSLGLPADRAEKGLEILKENGKYAGIIKDTPHGLFVNLDSPTIPGPAVTRSNVEGSESLEIIESEKGDRSGISAQKQIAAPPTITSNKVFISHGKNKAMVMQIKELLAFGNFDPIVSVERETTAIPVPEKVFEDMRACQAGVIHAATEGDYLDKSGNSFRRINENVLIEIGAAIALYGKKVVLLVEKGTVLPSNLQGLYRCEYDGDKLDYEATMKLLKTFNQFK